MSTSFSLLALAGLLVIPAPAPTAKLVWWRDYQIAQAKGVEVNKPLALVVGSGPGGYEGLTQEGQLSDSVRKALAENYVCVYLDTKTPSHLELIKQLEVTKGQGLIISDRSGALQAFHHDGQLSEKELSKQLQHFANPKVEVTTTVSNATTRFSYYPTSQRESFHYSPATSSRSC